MAIDFQSKNEENIYIALTQMKVDFQYQYPIDGGRNVRGGQVIDFVLFIPPKPIALYIQGNYWHSGKKALEDQFKQNSAEKHGFMVIMLSEAETMTVDAAKNALRAKVL